MNGVNVTHLHRFVIPLTDGRGEQDGRYACSCGLVKPEPREPINHKGQLCGYQTGLLCQEGFCTECGIFQEYNRKTGGNYASN